MKIFYINNFYIGGNNIPFLVISFNLKAYPLRFKFLRV